MLETEQVEKKSLKDALAGIVRAEQHLANAGGEIPLDDMTALDAKSFDAMMTQRDAGQSYRFSRPGFEARARAEEALFYALADYLVRTDGRVSNPDQHQLYKEQSNRLILRCGRIGAAVEFNQSPKQFQARKNLLLGRFELLRSLAR